MMLQLAIHSSWVPAKMLSQTKAWNIMFTRLWTAGSLNMDLYMEISRNNFGLVIFLVNVKQFALAANRPIHS